MIKPGKHIDISTRQAAKKLRALKGLRWPLHLTFLGLLAERVTRAFWPLWSLAFVLWTALAFGLQGPLNLEATYFATLIAVAGLIWALVFGLGKFRWPAKDAVIDRLDRSLKGRPLTALWDNQAIGNRDRQSTAVWQAHVAQMARLAAQAGAVRPDLRISRRDPFGLRYLAATALVVGVLFGPVNRGDSLIDRLSPNEGAALTSGPIYEGWIEPPRYTGLPTLYLNDLAENHPVPVPQGSMVTLRLYGQSGAIVVTESLSGDGVALAAGTDNGGQDFTIRQSGTLSLETSGSDPVIWQFEMVPDRPPVIALTAPVKRTPRGEMEMAFTASDDYGVTGGTVVIALDLPRVDRRHGLQHAPEPRANIVLDIPLPFTGDSAEFEDVLVEDLAQHPFAGLPVTLQVQASDAAGQISDNAPQAIVMPGRRFFDPLAAAIVEQRRDLLWNRANARRVAQVLRATTHHPEDLFENERAFLVIRTALRRIEFNLDGGLNGNHGLTNMVRDDVADLLWRAALLIEDGNVSGAAERLRRAQERLSEALENGATDEEIAELMDALRQATQEYLEALARDAEQNPDRQSAANQQAQEITRDQLQALMDRIQELAEQGRNEEAQALLEQLRQMMENMQMARGDPNQQGQGPGQQSLQDLQDTLRQQQGLSDEAFRQLQDQFNGNRQPGQRPQNSPGQPGNNGPSQLGDLSERQEALRRLLDQQRQQVPGSDSEQGLATRRALERAEREMGAARDALRDGDGPGALDRQAEALDALREGIENLGQDMARNQDPNFGNQGDQAGSFDPESDRRDPLGRQAGTTGRFGSDEAMLPTEDIFRRSREILDEIRRRSGDRSRPRIELEYLQRLLDRF